MKTYGKRFWNFILLLSVQRIPFSMNGDIVIAVLCSSLVKLMGLMHLEKLHYCKSLFYSDVFLWH